jgi:Leucine-rich repeat (LRR) protein
MKAEKLSIRLRKNQATLPSEQLLSPGLKLLEIFAEGLTKLPGLIGDLKELEVLTLTTPSLNSFPEALFSLPALKILKIKNCAFGELPTQTPKFHQSLETLQLSGASLKTLPSWLGNLAQCQNLDLSDNHLTELPSEMKNLSRLSRLILDDNQFNQLPDWLASLPRLNHLSLDGNPLGEDERNRLFKTFGIWF